MRASSVLGGETCVKAKNLAEVVSLATGGITHGLLDVSQPECLLSLGRVFLR